MPLSFQITFRKDHLEACLLSLGCDMMARERSNFETYSTCYEHVLHHARQRLSQKEQVGSQRDENCSGEWAWAGRLRRHSEEKSKTERVGAHLVVLMPELRVNGTLKSLFSLAHSLGLWYSQLPTLGYVLWRCPSGKYKR